MLTSFKKANGFSLIEFVVVMVILTVITLMLLPSLTTYFSQNRLKSVAENLYDDILLGRTSAIEQSTNVTLAVKTGANWCYGMTTNTNCDCATANSCNLGQTTNTSFPKTSLSATNLTVSGTNSIVTFDYVRAAPSFATATNGIVAISSTLNNNQQITITINQLGTATMCSAGTVGGYGC